MLEQSNTTNTYAAAQRPNLRHSLEISGDRSRGQVLAQYFDTSAFQGPGTGVFGNAARNVGIGPGHIGMDTSVHKRRPSTEHLGLQLRCGLYSIVNRPNFAEPGNVRRRGEFGRISSILAGSNGRLPQFSMRMEFQPARSCTARRIFDGSCCHAALSPEMRGTRYARDDFA